MIARVEEYATIIQRVVNVYQDIPENIAKLLNAPMIAAKKAFVNQMVDVNAIMDILDQIAHKYHVKIIAIIEELV